MRRIIDRQVFEGKPIDDEYVLTVHELGNGHREAVVRQAIGWEHVHTLTAAEASYLDEKYGEKDAEERREANLERSARRAKTKVRRLVKSMGLDSLLTLTYRANQTDLELAKRHLKEFVRRVKRVIPGFGYVACFEQQERGAWHMHMATHKLPLKLAATNGVKVKSYGVVRAIWRSVTGELQGNIDQARRKRNSQRSSAKLASYLSKYMLKAYGEGDAWSNRYSASQHSIPEAQRAVFRASSLREMIELAYAFAADGSCEITTWLSRFGDTFYISTQLQEGPKPFDIIYIVAHLNSCFSADHRAYRRGECAVVEELVVRCARL